jgi:hypothetical protein
MCLAACTSVAPVDGQYPAGYPDPGPGQLPPQGAYPQPPQGAYPQPPQGAYPQPPQGAYPQAPDPINTMDLSWLRTTAGGVLGELIAALPPASQQRVANVPFFSDSTVGEVNAYAACKQGFAFMAMSDGLLQIEAYTAQLRAVDELYGTQKLDGYLSMVAKYQKPHMAIVSPPTGYVDPVQMVDPRKVARQHQLLEEQIAFVLGHELGHHYLGHTGCAVGPGTARPPNLFDIGLHLATEVVPFINQPNEAWADQAGVNDLLTAGARRQGYHWTEQGALLTLSFFSRLDQLAKADPLSPEGLVYTFESSHPRPEARVPDVQREAAAWRARGGAAVYPPTLR